MSLGNTTETEILNYIFDSTAPAWAANANFWIALHTADPGEAGTAITSEASYTSYARLFECSARKKFKRVFCF